MFVIPQEIKNEREQEREEAKQEREKEREKAQEEREVSIARLVLNQYHAKEGSTNRLPCRRRRKSGKRNENK